MLREVGGEVAHYFDPDDPPAAAAAIEAALGDDGGAPAPAASAPPGSPGTRRPRGTFEAYDVRSRGGGLMHVGLNLVYLVPGETGGMEVFARELIPRAGGASPASSSTAFVNREAAAAGADRGAT